MLMYTGRGNFLLQPLDANELVADISDLLGASVARRVTLTTDLAPLLPEVVADAAQMRHAVLGSQEAANVKWPPHPVDR